MIIAVIISFIGGVIITTIFAHLTLSNTTDDLKRYARAAFLQESERAYKSGYVAGMRDGELNAKNETDVQTALIPAVR